MWSKKRVRGKGENDQKEVPAMGGTNLGGKSHRGKEGARGFEGSNE